MREQKSISEFSGEYRFLSNFWAADVWLDDLKYPSVEHAYQAAKTDDRSIRAEFVSLPKPGLAKRMGQQIKSRSDWESVKLSIMRDLVGQKFMHNKELRLKLIGTGGAQLIEGNTWGDTFWGVCKGRGLNFLGLILMMVRSELLIIEYSNTNKSEAK